MKKDSDNNMFRWSLQIFSEQFFYKAPVEATIGGVLCEYLKILRTPILKNICERLLLQLWTTALECLLHLNKT